MNKEFNAGYFKEVRRKMDDAENFIIDEGKKMGIELTREQACIFANAVLKAYGI